MGYIFRQTLAFSNLLSQNPFQVHNAIDYLMFLFWFFYGLDVLPCWACCEMLNTFIQLKVPCTSKDCIPCVSGETEAQNARGSPSDGCADLMLLWRGEEAVCVHQHSIPRNAALPQKSICNLLGCAQLIQDDTMSSLICESLLTRLCAKQKLFNLWRLFLNAFFHPLKCEAYQIAEIRLLLTFNKSRCPGYTFYFV